jgi:hypothetical protein
LRAFFLVVSKIPANAMAIYPFILLRHKYQKNDQTLINHERIHLHQQIELLILPFYLFYLFNYLANLIRYRNHHRAYVNIVFEKEAYACDQNLNYLENRKFFSWINHF